MGEINEKRFNLAASIASAPDETRGQDARSVGDEEIVRREMLGDVADESVLECAMRTMNNEQASALARSGRVRCDRVRWEFVIEFIGSQHVKVSIRYATRGVFHDRATLTRAEYTSESSREYVRTAEWMDI
jgi:hypothetical protein